MHLAALSDFFRIKNYSCKLIAGRRYGFYDPGTVFRVKIIEILPAGNPGYLSRRNIFHAYTT
jgi:hypothetical protein